MGSQFDQGNLLELLATQVLRPRPDNCPRCGAGVEWDGDRMRGHVQPTSKGGRCDNVPRESWADDITMVESLRFAVPICLAEIRAITRHDKDMRTFANIRGIPLDCDDTARDLFAQRWLKGAARAVGERGDALRYGTKRSGVVAVTFTHLAHGLAALAQMTRPGGVDLWGLHWCVDVDCVRCRRPRPPEATSRAEMVAELERIDADFRALTGMPPWTSPAAVAKPEPRSLPARAGRRVVTIPTGGHL